MLVDVRNDRNVLAVGRYPEGEKGLLCWTGSALVIRGRLREWSAEIEADWQVNSPYMGVLVDGAPVARFALGRGKHDYTLLTGLDETVEHEFTLFRDTQPMGGEEKLLVRVTGMTVDGDLLSPKEKPVIEVIGDSLTTGEGTVGPRSGQEWRSVWLCGMNTWAQAMCQALDARGEWVSQSGWGLYTGWDNNPDTVLSAIYESAAAHSPYADLRHDFAAHPVRAVVVNLGTNDWNALKDKTGSAQAAHRQRVEEAALSLLAQIHRCRPGTPVLLIYGMCTHELADCLRAAAEKDAEAFSSLTAFLELPECTDQELGSRGHPGAAFQRRCGLLAAEKLRALGVF